MMDADGSQNQELRLLTDPQRTWREYLGTVGVSGTDPGTGEGENRPSVMRLGMIEVGLRMETDRRIFGGVVGNSLLALSREEICSALGQTMKNAGIYEEVQVWYERLCDWDANRRVAFVGEPLSAVSSAPAVLLPGTSQTGTPDAAQLSPRTDGLDGE